MRNIIQSHPVLAQRYRAMARAYLSRDGFDKHVYDQLVEMAEEHERKSRIYGRKRGKTFIFIRR